MTVRLAPDAETRRRLAAVALGQAPADLVVAGGALVDVFTEEVLEGWGVAVAGGRVAYVGPEANSRIGPQTRLVDAAGDLISPGLVEPHSHLVRIGLGETARLQAAAGVTTTVLETSEVGYACGPAGVRALLELAAQAPGRILLTVPPLIGLDGEHERRIAPAQDWIALFDEPRVLGVGELYWAPLLAGHQRAERLIEAALARGLAVEGHGAGARGRHLNALTALGWGDDHEGTGAEQVVERLRLGLHTLARQGATRRDLDAIAAAWQAGPLDLGRLSLTTDGVDPDRLLAGDSLNQVVERAVALGLPLARAVRLASRNPAERFGLGRWLGGLGPGMLADLVIVPRGEFRPRLVLSEGRALEDPVAGAISPALTSPLVAPVLNRDLLLPPGPGTWRAIEFTAPLVTAEALTDGAGALVVVAADRLVGHRNFRGLLLGFGMQEGAVALTTGWESASILIVGSRPADMTVAAGRLVELGGGAVVAAGKEVLAQWRAPLAGALSPVPAAEVAAQVGGVEQALRSLGCRFPSPLLSLDTLTSPAIPHLRISPSGYVRIKDGALLGLT